MHFSKIKPSKLLVLTICLLLTCAFILKIHHRFSKASPPTQQQALTLPQAADSKPTPATQQWTTVSVASGDSTAKIFSSLGIDYAELNQLMQLPQAKQHLTQLQVGQTLAFALNDQQLMALQYPFSKAETLVITKSNGKYQARIERKPVEHQLEYKSFTVNNSLFYAASQAGLTSNLYAQMVNVLQGSFNFNRDIHKGTHVDLVYDEYYIDGQKSHPGKVEFADITNGHKHHTAIRYTDPSGHTGYYTPAGQGLEPLYLLSPLHYKRISSPFSLHRLDPITHKIQPHYGVDFAAPTGTPIKSITDGTVSFVGIKGGYGNAVVVRYGSRYKGLYAHMSRFAKGIKPGQHVKKGQVIGYVGMTGWATGPHLHFGWYVNGIPRDPLKYVPHNTTSPVPSKYKADFLAHAKTILAKVATHQATQLANNANTQTLPSL